MMAIVMSIVAMVMMVMFRSVAIEADLGVTVLRKGALA